uniref:Homologous recombination OB-fold protein OB-fold domain-containing protein n=1 Tax=Ornithorhynchus anatinus TaxID=9258 RepID=A0A6I8N2N4_ORNAN
MTCSLQKLFAVEEEFEDEDFLLAVEDAESQLSGSLSGKAGLPRAAPDGPSGPGRAAPRTRSPPASAPGPSGPGQDRPAGKPAALRPLPSAGPGGPGARISAAPSPRFAFAGRRPEAPSPGTDHRGDPGVGLTGGRGRAPPRDEEPSSSPKKARTAEPAGACGLGRTPPPGGRAFGGPGGPPAPQLSGRGARPFRAAPGQAPPSLSPREGSWARPRGPGTASSTPRRALSGQPAASTSHPAPSASPAGPPCGPRRPPAAPGALQSPVVTTHLVQLVTAANRGPAHSPARAPPPPRRFPGPAGLLPQQRAGRNLEEIAVQSPHLPAHGALAKLRTEDIPASQSVPGEDFGHGPWQTMKAELGLDERDPSCFLRAFSIVMVLRKAALKQLPGNKVPRMAVMIKSLTRCSGDAGAVFGDPTGEAAPVGGGGREGGGRGEAAPEAGREGPTGPLCAGEMQGTVHRLLLEERDTQLKAGAVLLLRQIGVFSPSHRNHYLNVTPSNLVRIFSLEPGAGPLPRLFPRRSPWSGEPIERLGPDPPRTGPWPPQNLPEPGRLAMPLSFLPGPALPGLATLGLSREFPSCFPSGSKLEPIPLWPCPGSGGMGWAGDQFVP